jgi:cytochrome c
MRSLTSILLAAAAAAMACGAASAQEKLGGDRLFRMQCATCHSSTAGEPNRQGPNLFGVVGRRAGTAPGMHYSDGFREALEGKAWNETMLDKWLEDPQQVAPDAVMLYRQDDPEKRQAIIDYLKTLH